MEGADDAIDRLERHVASASTKLPGRYSADAAVFRPSPWRIVPWMLICVAASLTAFVSSAPVVLRVLAAVALLPLPVLGLELLHHRVSATATGVTDATWRGSSTTDGSSESYTVLAGPVIPRLSWSQRQHPSIIVWTGTDGLRHRLSLQWFSREDTYEIIAAVRAL
ncbi:MAG: hypothetical protein H6513_04630 [Acidimicrobiaceae bacterium]|nr:hypothetical protein [Actinomycetota bacterium]MCB9379960.1 hypothetical protein [Acidimicrobiaceae bacterium]MCO5331863.1 hypothetical protein [Ilumatobacteraceae bacterium]